MLKSGQKFRRLTTNELEKLFLALNYSFSKGVKPLDSVRRIYERSVKK